MAMELASDSGMTTVGTASQSNQEPSYVPYEALFVERRATVENLRSMLRAEAPWLLKDPKKIRRVILRLLDEAER